MSNDRRIEGSDPESEKIDPESDRSDDAAAAIAAQSETVRNVSGGVDPEGNPVDAERYKKLNRMGTERVSKLLMEFAIPSIIAMVTNGLYNIVDAIFLGHGVGEVGLATARIALPMMIFIMAMAMLIGNGGNALVALRLGEGKKREAERILGICLTLFIVAGIVGTAFIFLFTDGVLRLSGASPSEAEIWASCHTFLRIISFGVIFQFLAMGFNNFIRTAGNPSRALCTMVAGISTSALLNWIFVIHLGWGVAGSAWATVIGQGVGATLVLHYFIASKKAPFHLKLSNMPIKLKIALGVLALGSASFMLQIGQAVVNMILNYLINKYGATSLIGSEGTFAALGVVNNVAMFTFFPIMGIAIAAQPLIGFNYGARNFERVKKTFWMAFLWIMAFGLAFWILVRIFPGQIAMLFGISGDLLHFTASAIQIQLFMIPVMGLQILASSHFQSTGQPVKSLILSMSRQIIIMIPLFFILPIVMPLISAQFVPVDGLIWAFPICDATSALTSGLMMRWEFKRIDKIMAKHKQEEAGAMSPAVC
ncbi:MAG: MATE family efflux transporter [Coriobacteriales bacterium]|jgi:putative MATE family efflux protein|nr:MATE family efflux transporter [Coriobacteriales bacterium]